ncbi:MAG: bifunctional UDP-N-acetylglucosamine diphosphorylase/glucosamine-1-phosphate N-acetyltransferase GlmU [Halanaerobium sp.]|nr:bifunctional UDP-N-acetylglucosamine diphosphorylase/glucosamine-1-phosphate N-acetyltransferase GlmU [Halanaerobium sp.]
MRDLATIVLAAGKGTRMKSKLTKVLHPILGQPMLQYILETVCQLNPVRNLVVIGHQADQVRKTIGEETGFNFIIQEEQLGTGHAVKVTREKLADFGQDVLILYGDTPLLTADTLKDFIASHQQKGAVASVLTARLTDPTGYGRIVRDEDGTVKAIVEETDLTSGSKDIREINSGIYLFAAPLLLKALAEIKPDNAQGEYYLTDVVTILRNKGHKIHPFLIKDQEEICGVNDRARLAEVAAVIRERINRKWMKEGVTILDPTQTYIQPSVSIEPDVTIYPGVYLEGNTTIGEDTLIGSGCRIKDSCLGQGVEVQNSIILESKIGDGCKIGPFAYIRPGTELAEGVKIGDFVEVKKSKIGEGTKVPHLSYVGDTRIGSGTNVGAGTITANYDGINKNKTIIGSDAFIGSNCTLVAPVEVGDRAMTGAGSVVTKDVKEATIVVGVPARPLKRRED